MNQISQLLTLHLWKNLVIHFYQLQKFFGKILSFLNTRNTWVKLASGISVGDGAKKRLREIIESDGYVGSGVIDENNIFKNLAKNVKSKLMKEVMGNVSRLLPNVLDKGLPDVTGPSMPTTKIPAIPKLWIAILLKVYQ